MAAITMVGMHELFVMVYQERRKPERWVMMLCGALMVGSAALFSSSLMPLLLLLSAGIAALLFLFRYQNMEQVGRDAGFAALGFLYVPFLLTHFVWLRGLPNGREWIFFGMVIVMACDIAAYFTGVSIGKHRLYPAVSPKKSIEGSIGGLVGSLAGAWIAHATFFPALPLQDALILGLVMSLFGQVGDLFESLLKRSFGVKDSGAIIPGHGGILDRLDSLIFAFPVAYYYAHFLL